MLLLLLLLLRSGVSLARMLIQTVIKGEGYTQAHLAISNRQKKLGRVQFVRKKRGGETTLEMLERFTGGLKIIMGTFEDANLIYGGCFIGRTD